jgi:hypothetical protein
VSCVARRPSCLAKRNISEIEIMEGLSFQIETIRTPYESVLLGSQVYHLKAQPTCVWCPPTSVSLSLYIKECLGQATA